MDGATGRSRRSSSPDRAVRLDWLPAWLIVVQGEGARRGELEELGEGCPARSHRLASMVVVLGTARFSGSYPPRTDCLASDQIITRGSRGSRQDVGRSSIGRVEHLTVTMRPWPCGPGPSPEAGGENCGESASWTREITSSGCRGFILCGGRQWSEPAGFSFVSMRGGRGLYHIRWRIFGVPVGLGQS